MEKERWSRLEHSFPTHVGSMTELLEDIFQTRVLASALYQNMIPVKNVPYPVLELEMEGGEDEEPITVRKVVLCSEIGERLLYAETVFVPRRVPREVQSLLQETQIPLGRLLKDLHVPMRRSPPLCERINADAALLQALELHTVSQFLRRASCAWLATDGPPAMLITEWLPLLSEAL